MQVLTSQPGQSLDYLVTGYPWNSLEKDATVVDVGGSEGYVSAAIAAAHSHLNFVVQDRPEVVERASKSKSFSPDIDNRLDFVAYDFLTPQKVQGDVYLFRWILHDWPDAYVIKILRNQIPALRNGTKIVLNEQLMPAPGSVPLFVERQIR